MFFASSPTDGLCWIREHISKTTFQTVSYPSISGVTKIMLYLWEDSHRNNNIILLLWYYLCEDSHRWSDFHPPRHFAHLHPGQRWWLGKTESNEQTNQFSTVPVFKISTLCKLLNRLVGESTQPHTKHHTALLLLCMHCTSKRNHKTNALHLYREIIKQRDADVSDGEVNMRLEITINWSNLGKLTCKPFHCPCSKLRGRKFTFNHSVHTLTNNQSFILFCLLPKNPPLISLHHRHLGCQTPIKRRGITTLVRKV